MNSPFQPPSRGLIAGRSIGGFGMLDSLLRLAIWLLRQPAVRPAVKLALRGVRRIAGRESSRTSR